MVKSLKKFVRLDEAELQEADINKEIDLTLDLMRHETKNRINIIKNYSQLPLIKCYPNMLNQVFMNILINACQSIDKNGEVTITTEFENNSLVVKIKDNGKGIEPEKINKIFTAGSGAPAAIITILLPELTVILPVPVATLICSDITEP